MLSPELSAWDSPSKIAKSTPPDGGEPDPAASKRPTLVIVLAPVAVNVPTHWNVSLVFVVVNWLETPLARASAAGVLRSVEAAEPAVAPVPQPMKCGSAWLGVAPNIRPEITAFPTVGTKELTVAYLLAEYNSSYESPHSPRGLRSLWRFVHGHRASAVLWSGVCCHWAEQTWGPSLHEKVDRGGSRRCPRARPRWGHGQTDRCRTKRESDFPWKTPETTIRVCAHAIPSSHTHHPG